MADEKIRERARAHAETSAACGCRSCTYALGIVQTLHERGVLTSDGREVGAALRDAYVAGCRSVALSPEAPDAAALAAAREEGAKAERERIAAEVEAQALDHQGRAGALLALLDTLTGSGG